MTRRIKGLCWARVLPARPNGIPASRPRGAKAQGLRYERALAANLPSATHGQWFEFCDVNGHGFCQVDLLLPRGEVLVVLEVKYTWTWEAYRQLEELYLPVVEMALGGAVIGLQVCKRLVPEARSVTICASLEEAIQEAGERGEARRSVWHWLGGHGARDRVRTRIRPWSASALGL